MGRACMDAQFELGVYQAFLTLLVWLLATFACLGIVASVVLLFLECSPLPVQPATPRNLQMTLALRGRSDPFTSPSFPARSASRAASLFRGTTSR
jgi:hypothetical protein